MDSDEQTLTVIMMMVKEYVSETLASNSSLPPIARKDFIMNITPLLPL
jgi:hypothetical protein